MSAPVVEATTSEGIKVGPHWDLPMDDYHALTDWWSSTQIKRALPELYDEPTSHIALDFGKLLHSVVLEPDVADTLYVRADASEIGVKANGEKADKPMATAAWKAFVAQQEEAGKVIVDLDDWERVHRMRDALLAHPEARELLFSDDGQSEVSTFAIDENGVKHKARWDRLNPRGGVDLKSTMARPGLDNLTRVIVRTLYDLSAAHYLTVSDLADISVPMFTWVFVSKVEPFRVSVADADWSILERGRILRERAFERLLDPSIDPYEGATGRLTISCPPWAAPYDSEMEID